MPITQARSRYLRSQFAPDRSQVAPDGVGLDHHEHPFDRTDTPQGVSMPEKKAGLQLLDALQAVVPVRRFAQSWNPATGMLDSDCRWTDEPADRFG